MPISAGNRRCLPDKAIDVIDESGARVRLKAMTRPPDLKELDAQVERLNQDKEEAVANQDFERAASMRDKADKLRRKKEEITKEWRDKSKEIDGVVDQDVIAEVVSKMTGIPLMRLAKEEAERLLHMEDELHKKVVRQSEAIKAIAKAVRRSRSGLKDPKRPTGCFVFAGPTGVGKTHLAKCLAEFMFGDPDALIQIDMSEYMEKHNVSRLIGAPPGYVGYEEGGQLTERIRRRPYAVVLLDEIEKAHPDVYHMLLQIMEEGRLTDSFGRHVDFKNSVLIMTTNAGADVIKNQSSFGFMKRDEDVTYEKMKDMLKAEIEKYFRPEFLNRVDDVIVFRPLAKVDLKQIIDIELEKVRARLEDRGLYLILTDDAKEMLIDKGYNPEYGARPLRRAIENYIEDPLSEELLKGEFQDKDTITVRMQEVGDEKKLIFDASSKAAGEEELVGATDSSK
jgi:ATP-dependent Clp protease ATP-binding subunit ClpC